MCWDEIVVTSMLFPISIKSIYYMTDESMLCSLKFACVRGPARHAGAHQRIVQHSARLIPWPWPWSWPLINSRAEEIERIILFLSSPITAVCGREREREANANADLPTVRGCVQNQAPPCCRTGLLEEVMTAQRTQAQSRHHVTAGDERGAHSSHRGE